MPPRQLTLSLRLAATLLAASWMVSAPDPAHAAPPAGISGTLSIIPGLGQVANGNFFEGLAWFGSVAGTAVTFPGIALELWQYNMYDAYRDAKPKDRNYTEHGFVQHYLSVFNPLNILDPIGAPFLVGYGVWPGYVKYRGTNLSITKALSTAFIGPAEEGLFRGFLFPGFSSLTHSKIAGALISSAIFGYAHTQYDMRGRLTVAAVGLLQCWQADRNRYDLRKNMFAHSWVDFFLLPRGEGPLPEPIRPIAIPPMGLKLNFIF